MSIFAQLFIAAAVAASTAAPRPEIFEMDVDRPTLQVNHVADAVRGMKSGKTCRLAREIFSRFGGEARKNHCSLAIETEGSIGYFGYCDAKVSYLLQLDLNTCKADELLEFHGKRLTGTAVIDKQREQILFSYLGGSHLYNIGNPQPTQGYTDLAVYSKHEYFADANHLYILNTILPKPVIHRVDLNTKKETRVGFGKVLVIDYAGGRLLIRGVTDPRAFGLYDARTRKVVQRWRGPAGAKAHFVGEGWVAFWTKPTAKKQGDWILTNAVTGESVYHGKWTGKKPPSLTWKGRVLYAGKTRILVADKAAPIRTPVQKLGARKAG